MQTEQKAGKEGMTATGKLAGWKDSENFNVLIATN